MMIYQIVKQLTDIAFLRQTPECLPYRWSVLFSILALNFSWRFLGALAQGSAVWAFALSLTPMIVMALLLYLLLSWRRQEERFFKLYLALQGTAVLLGMGSWALFMLVQPLGMGQALFLIVSIWQFFVIGHILHFGLEVGRWTAIGMGFLLMMGVLFGSMPVFMMLGVLYNTTLP